MNRINPIKSIKRLFCAIIFTVFCTMTIWAGTWEQQEQGGYRYRNDDGTYLINTWLQENGKWYFLDENGLLPAVTQQEVQTTVAEQKIPETTAAATMTVTYVLNKNTKKFHKPSCSSITSFDGN